MVKTRELPCIVHFGTADEGPIRMERICATDTRDGNGAFTKTNLLKKAENPCCVTE